MVAGPHAASAAVASDPFHGLVAELEARSAALEGSETKADIKLRKRLDKVVKMLDKASGLDAELKAAGKAAKRLAKLYPGEMAPGNGADAATLYDLVTDPEGIRGASTTSCGRDLQTAQATSGDWRTPPSTSSTTHPTASAATRPRP